MKKYFCKVILCSLGGRRHLRAVLALPGTVHCGTSLALTLSRVGLVVREQVWWAVLYE